MAREYITSEEHLPDDLDAEVTFQVTDRETKEIFTTRARVSDEAADLTDPDRLTIVRGPHENIREEWYIDVLEAEVDADRIDRAVLRDCIEEARSGSNIVNARSEAERALLAYLVDRGRYESVSEAVRSILRRHLREERPALVDAYIEVTAELARDDLTAEFEDAGG